MMMRSIINAIDIGTRMITSIFIMATVNAFAVAMCLAAGMAVVILLSKVNNVFAWMMGSAVLIVSAVGMNRLLKKLQ